MARDKKIEVVVISGANTFWPEGEGEGKKSYKPGEPFKIDQTALMRAQEAGVRFGKPPEGDQESDVPSEAVQPDLASADESKAVLQTQPIRAENLRMGARPADKEEGK